MNNNEKYIMSEIKKWLKRALKNKVSITDKTVITFLMTGVVSLVALPTNVQAAISINRTDGDTAKNSGINLASSTGTGTIAIGENSKALTNYGVALGFQANAATDRTLSIGVNAGLGSTQGNDNLFIGANAGRDVNGGYNGAIGSESGRNVTGNGNYSFGYKTGNRVNGNDNFSFGTESGSDVQGQNNYTFGYQSGQKVSGNANVSFGGTAGTNVVGNTNYAFGYGAGQNVVGDDNYAMGKLAGTNVGKTGTPVSGNIALGDRANRFSSSSNALTTNDNIAIGTISIATGGESIALGKGSKASGSSSIATGTNSIAVERDSIAIGNQATANTVSSIAIGSSSDITTQTTASGQNSTAIGYNSKSIGMNATAIGSTTTATGVGSTAIGSGATATQTGTIAIGATQSNEKTEAKGQQSIAIGLSSTSQGAYSISIGKGTSANGVDTIAIGRETFANNSSTVAIGTSARAEMNNSIAIGKGSSAKRENTIAIGESNVVDASYSGVLGRLSEVSAQDSYVIGNNNKLSSQSSRVFGNNNKFTSSSYSSSVIGNSNDVTANNVFVLGNDVYANKRNSVYLGNSSSAEDAGSTTAGFDTYNSATVNGITYSDFSGQSPNGVVTVGEIGGERRIQNVAAGLISQSSTDAINGSQLYTTNSVIGNVANSTKNILGGNATVRPNGRLTMSDIGDTGESTIHDAIKKVNDTTATNTRNINNNTSAISRNTSRISNLTNTINAGTFTVSANGGTKDKIAKDENIDFTNTDDNIIVSYDNTNNMFIHNLAQNLNLGSTGSITAGSTTLNGSGLSITGGPSITTTGINAGNKEITNVGTPTTNSSATTKQYVDDGRTKVTSNNNSVTVNHNTSTNTYDLSIDTSNIASATNLTYKANGTNSQSTTLANGLDFKDGTMTTATVGANGEVKYDLNATTQNLINNAANNNLSNLTNAGNSVISGIADKSVKVVQGTNTIVKTNTVANSDGTSTTTYTINADKSTTSVSSALDMASTMTADSDGVKTTNYALDLSQTTKDNIQKGVDAKDIVDTKGLTFTGDSGTTGVKKLGDTIAIVGDSNITTTATTSGVQVELNKNLNLGSTGSITAGNTVINTNGLTNGNTTLNGSGLSITGGPSITTTGINAGGMSITNVANGVNPTDAVNVSQLNNAVKNSNDNSPFEYANANGDKVVKGENGKYYKESDLVGLTYDPTTGTYKNSAGITVTPTEIAEANVVIRAKDTAKPITNIASGITGVATTTKYDENNPTTAKNTVNTLYNANGSDLNRAATIGDIQALAVAGLDFTGNNTSTTVHRGLGRNLNIVGEGTYTTAPITAANNIYVEGDATNNTLTVKLNKDVDLGVAGSLTTGNTTVNNGGVTINAPVGGTTTAVSLTNTGLNNGGNAITNVGNGINPTDAVNVSQLNNAVAQANRPLTFAGDSGTNVDRQLGTTVNIVGGATSTNLTSGNIGVVGNGTDKLEIKLNKDVNLGSTGSLATGNTTINNNGLSVVNGANSTTTTANGTTITNGTSTNTSTATSNTISNGTTVATTTATGLEVKSNTDSSAVKVDKDSLIFTKADGTAGVNINATTGRISNVSDGVANNDAVNVSQLNNAISTLNTNISAAKTEVQGGTNTNVSSTTGANGQTIYTVNADKTEVATTGTGLSLNSTVATDSNGTKTTTYTIGLDTTTLSTSPTGRITSPVAADTGKVVTAGDVANAINSAGFNVIAGSTGTGTTSGTVANELITAGSSVKLEAGNNLNVNQANGTFTYSLANDVSVNSVSANTLTARDNLGNTSTLSGNGLTINNGPSITTSGINAGNKVISNVAQGTAPTDAVNVSQLTQAVNTAKTELEAGENIDITSKTGTNGQTIYTVSAKPSTANLSSGSSFLSIEEEEITANGRQGRGYKVDLSEEAKEKINNSASKTELNNVDKRLRAGVAGVAAMASIPQINEAASNRYNIAVGGGHYKGENAFAVGLSGVSDGGRVVYKAAASINSKSDLVVGIGAGYQFGKRDVQPNELDRLKAQLALLNSEKGSLKEENMQLKLQLMQVIERLDRLESKNSQLNSNF